MPGNGVSTWKLLLLGVTVMTASFIGIVLQILTYRRVQQLYRDHPTLRRMDQHLFHVRYQQHPVGYPALLVKVARLGVAQCTLFSRSPSLLYPPPHS